MSGSVPRRRRHEFLLFMREFVPQWDGGDGAWQR
jgi:hypothetical protein